MASLHGKRKIPSNEQLLSITDRYLVDLECLREMFATVMPVLREQDNLRQKDLDKLTDRITEVFEKKSTDEDAEPSTHGKSEESESEKAESRGEKVARVMSILTDSKSQISNVKKIKRAQTLFAKQSIVSFVSRFDEFLGPVLEIALAQNPGWLKSSEKVITYKELIDLKSIDTAIKGVIAKEVENLMRGTHEEQILYIDERLKLGIREHFPNIAFFFGSRGKAKSFCTHWRSSFHPVP